MSRINLMIQYKQSSVKFRMHANKIVTYVVIRVITTKMPHCLRNYPSASVVNESQSIETRKIIIIKRQINHKHLTYIRPVRISYTHTHIRSRRILRIHILNRMLYGNGAITAATATTTTTASNSFA